MNKCVGFNRFVLWLVAFFFFLGSALSAQRLEDKVQWIEKLPNLSEAGSVLKGKILLKIYVHKGKKEKLVQAIREGLVKRGWSLKPESQDTLGDASSTTMMAHKGTAMLWVTYDKTGATSLLSVKMMESGAEEEVAEERPVVSSASSDYEDYQKLSGEVITTIRGNYIVPSGEDLDLVGTLEGNLVVSKGARANIQGTIEGNVVNYGRTDIVGTVEGDVTNIGGRLDIVGLVKGKVIRK